MQVEIEGRNTEVRQSWRDLIEQKLGKFEHFPNEITRARVTITHNPHHHLGDNQVQVVLAVAGQTLTVKKKGAQIPDILRSALTAAEREVETYHQNRFNRKRTIKATSVFPTGTVARIFRTKGYGYIQTSDGQVYFHRDVLDGGLSFDELVKGTTVSFELSEGDRSLRATRVFIWSNSR